MTDNPELARARELGVTVLHRSEALVWALDGLSLVAVAGSHGKTTTSAMTARALHGAGIDASFAVGARVFGVPGAVAGGYAGTSGVGVVEADESDGSFLRYHPRVGIITSIEPDHLDFYGTVDALHDAFRRLRAFLRSVGCSRGRPRGCAHCGRRCGQRRTGRHVRRGGGLGHSGHARLVGCRRRYVPMTVPVPGVPQSTQRRRGVGRGR